MDFLSYNYIQVMVPGNTPQKGCGTWTAVVGSLSHDSSKPLPEEKGGASSAAVGVTEELSMVDIDLTEPLDTPLEFD